LASAELAGERNNARLPPQITGISNEMVRDAPSIEAVLPEFLDFIDGADLVTDELGFDLSFVRHAQSQWMRTNQG
jgi:DNA polymerase-3 subunit epsilon